MSSDGYQLRGTVGQIDVGEYSSQSYRLVSGFEAIKAPLFASIELAVVPRPRELPEPGGPAEIELVLSNTGEAPIQVLSLMDSFVGDLNGAGSCSTPFHLDPGDFYSCVYSVSIVGNAGETLIREVSVQAQGPVRPLVAEAGVSFPVTDVLPRVALLKTALPKELSAPGGEVLFSAQIRNLSPESVNLLSLVDDVHGDLSGRGTCLMPQTLNTREVYSCEFAALVEGPPGFVEVDTITVTAQDDEGNLDQGSDTAMVTLLNALTDVSAELSDRVTWVSPGDDLSYLLTVTNLGPSEVPDLLVRDPLPLALVGCSWSCDLDGSSCGAGAGDVATVFDLAVGQSASIQIDCSVSDGFEGSIFNIADVRLPSGIDDTRPENNQSQDLTFVGEPFFYDGFESGDFTGWSSDLDFKKNRGIEEVHDRE